MNVNWNWKISLMILFGRFVLHQILIRIVPLLQPKNTSITHTTKKVWNIIFTTEIIFLVFSIYKGIQSKDWELFISYIFSYLLLAVFLILTVIRIAYGNTS